MQTCFWINPLSDCFAPHGNKSAPGLIQFIVGRETFPNLMYVIYNHENGDAVVVDPGWEPDLLCEEIARRGLVLRGIAVTHSHIDHAAYAAYLSAATDAPVYASQDCMQTLGVPPIRQYALTNDTAICAGSLDITALMTPGHTSCSVCFLIGDDLFSGDTLFIEGCGLATLPGGNAADLYRSCAKLKAHISDSVRVWPAHQYRNPVGALFSELRTSNFYLRLRGEEDFIAFCSRRRNKSAPPLVGTVPERIPEVCELPPRSQIELRGTAQS